ncbi:hypothetical protein LTR51_003018 [Lithohypha guttulata]|nr:hypothetical protein LTR51_003018 [Lithohypha guttulata]
MQAIRREERIRKALIDNKTTTDGNISQAARNNDVARTTLLHRRDGRPSHAFTRPSNTRLTYQQEEVLAKLIANQQAQFMPTSHTQIRTIAYLMSKDLNGQDGPIGINWVTKFINRHANIKSRKELYLDINRVSASNLAILDAWFSAAQLALQGQQVDDQDVWNMDEPLDQQPFAILKASYARLLKAFDPDGNRKVTRAQFNVLWAQARGEAFTTEYIVSGWRRSGLRPWNRHQLLTRPEVANYRPVTPDFQPEKTVEFSTPKRKQEWLPIFTSLNKALPSHRRQDLDRLRRHMDELEAEVKAHRYQLSLHHREEQREEDNILYKRIRKNHSDITTRFADVLRHRQIDEDTIELYQATQPDVFALMTDRETRRKVKKRTRQIASNMAVE